MSKGTRREREAVELYQRAGMGTYRPATVRFGENDVFGLFDILAFSPAHDSLHAVQVKSNGAKGIRAWSRHTALWRRLGFRTFYACPYDNEPGVDGGWRLVECETVPGGGSVSKDVVDERDMDVNMGEGIVAYLEDERI